MAGLDAVLNWLRGPQPTPSLGLEQAPALPAYPSQHDADYARNYGFADGASNEDYLNNNTARVLGQNAQFQGLKRGQPARDVFIPAGAAGMTMNSINDPRNSAVVNLNDPTNAGVQDQTRNVMMQAALASNRSPIAAMGFDPSKVMMDTVMKNPTVGGLYSPTKDSIYTNLSPDDSVVHESTHRGIQKLREKYPEQVKAIAGDIPPQTDEMIVRWLMKSRAGDPEGRSGDRDAAQRQEAVDMFEPADRFSARAKNQEIVRQLEELAIQDRLTRSRRSGPQ